MDCIHLRRVLVVLMYHTCLYTSHVMLFVFQEAWLKNNGSTDIDLSGVGDTGLLMNSVFGICVF